MERYGIWLIGAIMAAIAVVPAIETKSLLPGESATRDDVAPMEPLAA